MQESNSLPSTLAASKTGDRPRHALDLSCDHPRTDAGRSSWMPTRARRPSHLVCRILPPVNEIPDEVAMNNGLPAVRAECRGEVRRKGRCGEWRQMVRAMSPVRGSERTPRTGRATAGRSNREKKGAAEECPWPVDDEPSTRCQQAPRQVIQDVHMDTPPRQASMKAPGSLWREISSTARQARVISSCEAAGAGRASRHERVHRRGRDLHVPRRRTVRMTDVKDGPSRPVHSPRSLEVGR